MTAAGGRPRAAVAFALLVPPVILMWDAILGRGALYQRDVHLYWHPQAEAFVRAVMAGSWPVWDRTVGFGQAFLANSSAQVLYPLTWLNLLIRPWWYYTVFVVAHLVLSAAGAYLAGRRLGGTRAGAAVGAMLWTSCGPFVSMTILWHHFAGAAWLPWVVVAAHGLATARTTRSALALGGVLAAQQLAGSFDMSTMGALLAAAWILRAMAWPRPWASVSDRRLLLRAAGAFVLALGLSAGQWMATVEAAAHSGRRSLPREVRTYWSVHPLTMADLLLPGFSAAAPVSEETRNDLFERREPFLPSLYLGPSSFILVMSALRDRERGRLRWFLASMAGLALLVALGRHTPVYDLLVAAVPPLKAFRYPVKAMVLVALPWCLLAGMGTDAWRRAAAGDERLSRAIQNAAQATALAVVAMAAFLFAAVAPVAARNATLAGGLAVVTAIAAGWMARPGTRPAAPIALAAAIAIGDLLYYHRSLNDVSPLDLYTHRPEVLRSIGAPEAARIYAYDYSVAPAANVEARPVSAQRLERMPAGWEVGPSMALAQQMALAPMSASRWGVRGSYEVDYTGLFPVHVNQAAYFLRSLEGTPDHRRLLQIAGVTHVVATHDVPFADLVPVATVPGLFTAPIRVLAVPSPMPLTYVATRTTAGEGIPGLLALVDPAFDFRSDLLIPAGAPPGPGRGAGASRIVLASPDRMTLAVEAPEGGYLVILESYDPGWRATVDGHAAAIVPANVLFRGIHLDPGAHVVDLLYRPPGLVAGLAVSAVSLLLAAVLAWRTSPSRVALRGVPA